MDGNHDAAVLAVPVDYSKAFNRMLHSNILNIVADISPPVPTCAIRLLKSYLTQRSMCLRYKGATSSFHKCPGGGPQGGLLTGLLFCIQVNKAGQPCKIPQAIVQQEEVPATGHPPDLPPLLEEPDLRPQVQQEEVPAAGHPPDLPPLLEQPDLRLQVQQEEVPATGRPPDLPPLQELPICHRTALINKKSYIDDLTLLEKISLSNLVGKERIIGPPPFRGRFHLKMPKEKSILQHQLEDLVVYTKQNSMILNSKKTKCLPFIMSRTKDFIPELTLEQGTNLEVIYSLKLVGLVISSDLRWQTHIDYTVTRVNKVLWQLTRFKQLGAHRDNLITFYILKVRSILLFGAACYHSALTSDQSQKLEIQQKISLAIILGKDYTSFDQARSLVNLPELKLLRESVCLKWAEKAQSNLHHSHLFPRNQSLLNTRNRYKFM